MLDLFQAVLVSIKRNWYLRAVRVAFVEDKAKPYQIYPFLGAFVVEDELKYGDTFNFND